MLRHCGVNSLASSLPMALRQFKKSSPLEASISIIRTTIYCITVYWVALCCFALGRTNCSGVLSSPSKSIGLRSRLAQGERRRKRRFRLTKGALVDFLDGKEPQSSVFDCNKDDVTEDDLRKLYAETQESIFTMGLEPFILVNYKRIAFQSEAERLSIDWDVEYFPVSTEVYDHCSWKDIPQQSVGKANKVILELKYLHGSIPEWFADLRRKYPIREKEFLKTLEGMGFVFQGPLRGSPKGKFVYSPNRCIYGWQSNVEIGKVACRQKRAPIRTKSAPISMVALGYWSAALTNGALRVVLPVYLASIGVSISKIAFLFFLFKFAEIFAPMGIGVMLNRWGYKRTFITGLAVHSLISGLFWFPLSSVFMWKDLFAECFYFADMSSVYVKHFVAKEKQRFLINMILGLKESSKGLA